MSERVVIGAAELWLGDCREILPTLGKVDAVVTDPPYGIGFARGAGGKANSKARLPARRNLEPIHGDDEPFDPIPFIGIAPDVILWGADHYAQRLPRGRWLFWDKLGGLESFDDFSDVEVAWLNKPGASRIFRHLWKGICRASEAGGLSKRVHPAQKPVALMEWCLGFVSGQTILDPYMGSGTTGVACARLGRRFIGIEIHEPHFDIACKRIDEAQRQGRLFDAPMDGECPYAGWPDHLVGIFDD